MVHSGPARTREKSATRTPCSDGGTIRDSSLRRRMRTLVISDLHLGGRTGVDVLRHDEVQAPLMAEIERADRLLLLGDTLELRQGPAREALANAKPVLERL